LYELLKGFTVTTRSLPPTAGTQAEQKELSLEDTGTARVRVLSPSEMKALDLHTRGVSRPDDRTASTGELRALSIRIQVQRELAELNEENKEARPKPKQ
jgi:hypothetical protein